MGMVMIVFTGHPEVAVPCLVIFLLALLLCLFTRYKKQTGIVMLLSAVIGGGHYGYHMWQYEQARKVPQMTAGNIDLRVYEPFSQNNQLARLDAPSTLMKTVERKTDVKNGILHLAFTALAVIVQIAWMYISFIP